MNTNTLLHFNREWSAAVYKQEDAMTQDQFLSYAAEVLFGEGSEQLYERIAECAGEIAMFGDSGPGSMSRLATSIREFNAVADRYEQLTGNKVHSRPRLPSYRY